MKEEQWATARPVALWRPLEREVLTSDCAGCPLTATCRELSPATGTALLWRRLGLVDAASTRLEVLDQPLADGLAVHLLLGGVAKVHAVPSSGTGDNAPGNDEDPQGTPKRTLGVHDL